MKPDELGASIGFALFLIALHQRGILVRAFTTITASSATITVGELKIPPERPELEAGNADLSRAYELTREAIEKARAS